MSDQLSSLPDAPDPVCAAPHKFGSFCAAEMSSPRSRSRAAGVKIATPKILMESRPIGSSVSLHWQCDRKTRCGAKVHALWVGIEPCPSRSLALQIENSGSPSTICNSNFGFSPLSHKAARCLVRYSRGPPSALSLRSTGRGMQTNSVSRMSPVTRTTA